MIVEMRTYKLKPGKRDEFLQTFRTQSLPAHAEIGMKILGPFLSIEDPDTFFFMRGFPDLASREPIRRRSLEERARKYPDADDRKVRRRSRRRPYIFNTVLRNVNRSAHSSMRFEVGLPAPWHARVSIRIRIGAGPPCACCSVAAYFRLWPGITRSS
jgi:hypothetical protein